MWLTAIVLALAADSAADPVAASTSQTPVASTEIAVTGTARQAVTPSFTVVSRAAGLDARQVACQCEQWRARLSRYWCDCEGDAWSPKCTIVVHSGRTSYLQAVGAGGGSTYGSSLLDFGPDKRVSKRQIDLRGDSPLGMAALPHEMTHVVLADHLGGRQPPRWADEGMAILADSRDKQLLHERDLNQGLATRQAFRIAELMTLDGYPHPSRVPAFYGQSASLTVLLANRDDPAKFVEFLRRSLDHGYDAALVQVYGIENLGELELLWREQRQAWRSGYHGLRLTLDERSVHEAAGAE